MNSAHKKCGKKLVQSQADCWGPVTRQIRAWGNCRLQVINLGEYLQKHTDLWTLHINGLLFNVSFFIFIFSPFVIHSFIYSFIQIQVYIRQITTELHV